MIQPAIDITGAIVLFYLDFFTAFELRPIVECCFDLLESNALLILIFLFVHGLGFWFVLLLSSGYVTIKTVANLIPNHLLVLLFEGHGIVFGMRVHLYTSAE